MRIDKNKIPIYILIVLLIFIFLDLCNQIKFVQDDAYITFRYVENFLKGKGLVFNEGEYVEGYTSLLWLILLIPFAAFKFDLASAAQILSTGFGVLNLITTYVLSSEIYIQSKDGPTKQKNYFDLVPVFLLIFTGGLCYWSVSGMETSLFIFLVLLGILSYIKGKNQKKINVRFVVIFILASLTRPEGLLVFICIFLHKFIFGINFRDRVERQILFKELLLFIIPYTLYLLFRLVYYGYLFPNTFYAKTGTSYFYLSRGINYFWDFAQAYLLFGVLFVIPIFIIKKTQFQFGISLFYFICLIYIPLIIIIGGDVLPMHRLFLPILPLFYIMFGKVLQQLYDSLNPIRLYKINLVTGILIFVITIGIFNKNRESAKLDLVYRTEIGLVAKMKVYAEWLAEKQEVNDRQLTVAASTIGALSYFSNIKLIDLLGLTDEYIAHNPKKLSGLEEAAPSTWRENHYNADYIISRKPDYIIFPAGAKPSGFPESAVFVNQNFPIEYYPQLIYSFELNQLLPVFTRRTPEQIEHAEKVYGDLSCDERFIAHYIEANNLLLVYIQTKNESLVPRILKECETAVEICPKRRYDLYTLMGMTYYHSKDLHKAKPLLLKVVDADDQNCIAHFYLKNIFIAENDTTNTTVHIQKLKTYSPDSLPYFSNKL